MGRVDAKEDTEMDSLKNLASNAGSAQEWLNGIQFPIEAEELADQLQQKGAPDQMVAKVRNADMSRFENAQDVLGKIQG